MTDKLIAAAKMALEAMTNFENVLVVRTSFHKLTGDDVFSAEINALGQALADLDTGIDRGAWADVPDATKWVDKLRGDEDLEEPPNSTTDFVEREPFGWLFKQADGDLYKLLLGEDAKWHEKNNPSWIKVSPLYTASPKREWQGLTDEEIGELYRAGWGNNTDFARAIEAKLREKNENSV